MKVLLFTHSQDIDGIGCALLAYGAFDDVLIVPTKTFDITKNVGKFIENKEIYKYDIVFVTDLCIKEPLLTEIDNNPQLKNKIIVIDHHKSEIDEGNDSYDFVNITIEINGKKESGTSLFYKYLLENNYLSETNLLNELTEWTRAYDVWDWKENKNYNARKLHILFETLGYEKYIELMTNKIKNDEHIEFNEFETKVINEFEETVKKDTESALKEIKIIELKIEDNTYKVGYIKIPYKYRNDINEYIINLNNPYNIDAVGMIMTDIDTVSYRQIKNIDVSKIATYFGGKGHFAASSNPQANKDFINMLNNNNIKF